MVVCVLWTITLQQDTMILHYPALFQVQTQLPDLGSPMFTKIPSHSLYTQINVVFLNAWFICHCRIHREITIGFLVKFVWPRTHSQKSYTTPVNRKYLYVIHVQTDPPPTNHWVLITQRFNIQSMLLYCVKYWNCKTNQI